MPLSPLPVKRHAHPHTILSTRSAVVRQSPCPLRRVGVRDVKRGPRATAQAASSSAVSRDETISKLTSTADVIQLYKYPALSASATNTLLRKASGIAAGITQIQTEICFNIAVSAPLTDAEASTLAWCLRETYAPDSLAPASLLAPAAPPGGASGGAEVASEVAVVEVGPRLSFSTAWSANAVSICASCGLSKVTRLERSRRYRLETREPATAADLAAFAALVHDRMTEQVYPTPLTSFKVDVVPEPVMSVPVMEQGMAALEEIDERLGLAFDDWDKQYYFNLFTKELKRNPTTVELFDLAQSNSEHCRHWFFSGNIVIDGQPRDRTLFSLVKEPWQINPRNSVVAFKDNSSAIQGTEVTPILPVTPGGPSPLAPQPRRWDLLLTAETHNFPCAVAPYPGAETGTGGRIRDTHATGTGSIMGAATAGYCVGNLRLPNCELPWEDPDAPYPDNLASPLQILIDASNGASDYGNKFGEPVIAGFTRSFGQRLPDGERREWIKPIMFSGGVGQIDRDHLEKSPPEVGMLVVKIGGPAYRIGMGGGAASSVAGGSRGKSDLDFNAVQRGDAEMAQKLWRVVRACVEMGPANPIVQIHDQGAGGNCNVVKEIIYPLGAEIDIRQIKLGDDTMSVLEIWGAEYQENDCILIRPGDEALLRSICERERTYMQVIGACNGSGMIVLKDPQAGPDEPTPVELNLETVLGALPQKTYEFASYRRTGARPLDIPDSETPQTALDRVLRLPAVGSKRFLTTKVDRCVTGLVAQQQCCGPLHIPVADVAVMAQSHVGSLAGLATSIGEAPSKGLLDPRAMARLAVAEALTNIVFAPVTDIADIRASVNWMYAAKLGQEGAAMYDAAVALRDAMVVVGMACDGGKDSLSMVANAGGERVMAPGELVVSAYVGCPDITLVVTPDLKTRGTGALIHVDLGGGKRRTGGSALAQVYGQLGDASPDVRMQQVKNAFEVTQTLVEGGALCAGHDISDGGIAVALLEMAFAGVGGFKVDLQPPVNLRSSVDGTPLPVPDAFSMLFAEELGLVLEVPQSRAASVTSLYTHAGVPCSVIGTTTREAQCSISVAGIPAVSGSVGELRDVWESTSFELERLQAAKECVDAEQAGLRFRSVPKWNVSFVPSFTDPRVMSASSRPRVAILREEGSNGDREMAAAVHMAGMEPWDVTMSDLLEGRAALRDFRGVVFVGGFSYADTLDSAKGWASSIRFSRAVLSQFEEFYRRPDTWSLGVCNGCQLMALLGWVPGDVNGELLPDAQQPRFVHNSSERFECRWATVAVEESPAVMLRGMAGSVLGIWVAHGEGRCLFPDASVRAAVLEGGLAPLRYADARGAPTEVYPFNPNGSPLGIAALCSRNGRHLAMMPHPERCFLGWQLPWAPKEAGIDKRGPSPWLRLFQNAREWCSTQSAASP